ncbi:restriction endonuclease subunit S [Falsiroseomonas sp.]|uniref:restriction endonuclease subunit S n=1 Tax=Falsiroseomonas sp. TaxID=2870721 RepID=UPI0035614186
MPESWRSVRLGDVAEVRWGDTSTTKASYIPTGFLAYSATGPDGFLDHFDHQGPGIVLSAIGAQCGKSWFADGQWSCIKNTIYVKGLPEHADTRFLFYVTSAPDFWPKRGAAQPFISQGDARAKELLLPSLPTQRRIASILGAYDDLIAVNRRRIALLEGMARRLFDEWFVQFRFPGHGHQGAAEAAAELPPGWRKAPLEEMLVLQRGFDLPAATRTAGPYPVIAATGPVGTHFEAKVKGPGVTTGRSGTLGSVLLVFDDFWPLNTALYVREFRRASPAYALFLLRHLDLKAHGGGAAVPTLNRNHIHGLPVPCPPTELVAKFEEQAMVWLRLARVLERQQAVLAASRGLLLPRLISGHLDVAAAERELEAAA